MLIINKINISGKLMFCLQVIDMLLFKGMEELGDVVEHAKQRHHIIGQYVVGHHGLSQDSGTKDEGASDFLKNFYKTNYFWTLLYMVKSGLWWGWFWE